MTEENARIAQVISGLEQGFVLENVRPDLALVTPEPGLTTDAFWSDQMAAPIETQARWIVTRERSSLQRRAWECAYVLAEHYAERLTLEQRIAAIVGSVATPDALTRERAGALVVLAAQVIGGRV